MSRTGPIRLTPAPEPLHRHCRALLRLGRHEDGPALAGLLPPGLHPGRGWPSADDLVGLALSPGFLVVCGEQVVGGAGPKGPVSGGVVEIGYGLAPAWHGRGIGTRAVTLLLGEMATRGAHLVTAQVALANAPSLALLDRLGFTPCEVPGGRAGESGYVWLSLALRGDTATGSTGRGDTATGSTGRGDTATG